MKVGDKVVSDDHAAIGVIQEVNGKLTVVGDFGSTDFNPEFSDWMPYEDWKRKNARRSLFTFAKKCRK